MDNDDLLTGIGIAATVAGTAEIILRLRDRAESKLKFHRERKTLDHPWEQFDPQSGWEAIPRFVSGDVIINSHGFRGCELLKENVTRVMCVGDSTTFGPPGEKHTYPHALQTSLNRRRTKQKVDVINAGINGHTTCNMLFRIQRLMKFRPGVVIVFAGWNDLFNDTPGCYRDTRERSGSYWQLQSGNSKRFHLLTKLRESAGHVQKKPLPLSYTLDEFIPFNYENNLRKILAVIRKNRAVPALLTLPKLIPDTLKGFTEKDKSRADLPDFLENGDFEGFLKLYNTYDSAVRQIASDTETALFDAAQLFEELKEPRGQLFEDTLHLSPAGYGKLGRFVAKSLIDKELIS